MAPSPSGRKGSCKTQPLPFRQRSPRVSQGPGRLRHLPPARPQGCPPEGAGIFPVRDLASGQARNEGRNLEQEGKEILSKAAEHSPELKMAMETWKEIKFEFDTVDKLDVVHR